MCINMENVEFITHKCPICKGPSHPATGSYYRPGVIACGPCVRELWKWFGAKLNSRPRKNVGPSFYDHIIYESKINVT